jgi:hypothetical protein
MGDHDVDDAVFHASLHIRVGEHLAAPPVSTFGPVCSVDRWCPTDGKTARSPG